MKGPDATTIQLTNSIAVFASVMAKRPLFVIVDMVHALM
jgi:hypothetical protein